MPSVALKSPFFSAGQSREALLYMGLNRCHVLDTHQVNLLKATGTEKNEQAYKIWVRKDHLHLDMKTSLTCDGIILPFLSSDEFSLSFPTLLLELHL